MWPILSALLYPIYNYSLASCSFIGLFKRENTVKVQKSFNGKQSGNSNFQTECMQARIQKILLGGPKIQFFPALVIIFYRGERGSVPIF